MWQLDNQTPFAADSTWIRDADGAEIWIVAVKASYALLPDGSTRIAAHQVPVNTGTVLHDDGVSPVHETDLGPPKLNTDVWLAGHAYPPGGQAVTRLRAGFEVGPVVRHLQVLGDRYRVPGLLGNAASAPQPFTQMALTWARAYGGSGPDCPTGNPVGRGIVADARGLTWLPNLEHPSRATTNLLVTSPSMGVGPVPRHWPQRSRHGGTYDAAWQATRAPLPPADVNALHWQVAPEPQQAPGHLRGGEPVALMNLTPPGFAKNGMYRFRLPRLTLGFRTRFYDGSILISRSVVHSVILQPDGHHGSGPLVSVVHHMHLPCHAKVNLLDRTSITRKTRPLDRDGT